MLLNGDARMQRPRDLVQRFPDFTKHSLGGTEPADKRAINSLVDKQIHAKHCLAESTSTGQHIETAGLIDNQLLTWVKHREYQLNLFWLDFSHA